MKHKLHLDPRERSSFFIIFHKYNKFSSQDIITTLPNYQQHSPKLAFRHQKQVKHTQVVHLLTVYYENLHTKSQLRYNYDCSKNALYQRLKLIQSVSFLISIMKFLSPQFPALSSLLFINLSQLSRLVGCYVHVCLYFRVYTCIAIEKIGLYTCASLVVGCIHTLLCKKEMYTYASLFF